LSTAIKQTLTPDLFPVCFQAAQRTQKLSTELFQCLYFKDKDPLSDPCCVADAVVYAIRANGLLVFIPQ